MGNLFVETRSMTTVAWSGREMAADTLVVENGRRVGNVSKVLRTPDGRLIGGAGSISALQRVFATLGKRRGKRPSPWPEGVDVLEVLKNGTCICREPEGPLVMRADFQAIGSGAAFAQTALALGQSPTEAVLIASSFDLCTGSEVECVSLDA